MTDPLDFGRINFRHLRHHDRLALVDMVEIAKRVDAAVADAVAEARKEYNPLTRAVREWRAARTNYRDLLRTRPRTPDAELYLAENDIQEALDNLAALHIPETPDGR